MSADLPIDQVVERVNRLLMRYDELNRTNALLLQQLEAVSSERDSLKSRLAAARARVDALLERLPAAPSAQERPALKPGLLTDLDSQS